MKESTVDKAVLINSWDFKFETMDGISLTPSGLRYSRKVPIGMPHLPKEILESVFYLYPTLDDATNGTAFGGTGVFIAVPSDDPREGSHTYAVTNWHVAVRDGCSVMRVNRIDGGVEIFEFDSAEWEFRPRWHDLALMPMFGVNKQQLKLVAISASLFVTQDDEESKTIGPGDDIFMVGRFVDHDGKGANIPAVRFGNISVMDSRIDQVTEAMDLPSYILDMHSRTGFSGSPVFVYRTFGSELLIGDQYRNRTTRFLKLLGLHWGSFPELWEIKSGAKPDDEAIKLLATPNYVKGMSGMSLAIPAEAILEMLNVPKHKRARKQATDAFQKANGPDLSPVAEGASAPPSTDENPTHQEDFSRLLDVAAKTPPQAD